MACGTRSWLRENVPESYEQLIDRLQQITKSNSLPDRTVSQKLVRFFAWCPDHNVQLAVSDLARSLPKYQEA